MCDQLALMLNLEENPSDTSQTRVPDNRLVTMLQQAVAYQIDFTRHHEAATPHISTLLEDYISCVLPNTCLNTLRGHTANLKCVKFIGVSGVQLATGSSDRDVRVWDTDTGALRHTLQGHTGRIWSIDSTLSGALLASSSGDGTVRLWNLEDADPITGTVLGGGAQAHEGDIYSTKFHPKDSHLVTGGYDKTVKLFDISTGQVDSVWCCISTEPHGRLSKLS